jgi:hypothetical protein
LIDPDNEDIVIPMRGAPAQTDFKPIVGGGDPGVEGVGPSAPTAVKRDTEPLDAAAQRPTKRRKGAEGAVAGMAAAESKSAVSAGAVSAAELRAYLVKTSGKVTIKELLGAFKKRLKSPEDQAAFRMVMQQIAKIQEVKQPDGSSKKVVVLKA